MLRDPERAERMGGDGYRRENGDLRLIRAGSRKKHPFKARSERDLRCSRGIGRVVSGVWGLMRAGGGA